MASGLEFSFGTTIKDDRGKVAAYVKEKIIHVSPRIMSSRDIAITMSYSTVWCTVQFYTAQQ
jgi:hypothetical protein